MPKTPRRLLEGRHTCKPRRYARRDDLPDTAKAKSVVVGVEHCMRLPHGPHSQVPDLTGVWEDEDSEQLSVVINHAGRYLALWRSWLGSEHAIHLLGKGRSPFFLLSSPEATHLHVGHISPSSRIPYALEIELYDDPPKKYTLVKVSSKVTLSDRALAYLGDNADADLVRRLEHAPISTAALRRFTEILTGPKMLRLIEEVFAVEISWRDHGPVKRLDTHVATTGILGRIVRDEKTPFWTASEDTKALLIRHAHAVMRAQPSTLAIRSSFFRDQIGASGKTTTQSVFDRLADLRAILAVAEKPVPPHPAIMRIGIPAPDERPRFEYAFEVHAEGFSGDAGIGLGAFTGTVRVRQLKPTEVDDWFTFKMFLVGGSGGGSVGIRTGFKMSGIGRSRTSWAMQDFLGRFSVYESTDSIAVGVGKSIGFTEWLVRGTSGKNPMVVAFGTADTHGIGAGKELGASEGYLRVGDEGFTDSFSAPTETTDYVAQYKGGAESHFELGSASPSEDGTHIVGWLAATELAALRDPGTTVTFIGSSDRVDTRWYNQVLSKMRAENALQVLKDAAGPDLKAKVESWGLGEHLATIYGDPDDSENPEFRKVFIALNGRTVAKLRGGESK